MKDTPPAVLLHRGCAGLVKGVKPNVLYDVDRGVVMEPMQGKWASSQFDFGYNEQFCIPGVTLVFFWSCDSVAVSIYLPVYLRVCLPIYLPVYLSAVYPSNLPVFLPICLSTCMSIYLPTYLCT